MRKTITIAKGYIHSMYIYLDRDNIEKVKILGIGEYNFTIDEIINQINILSNNDIKEIKANDRSLRISLDTSRVYVIYFK